ncbi:hypothetical protein GCM10027037_11870 [Mucilaginibacter koreensis]
MKFVDLIKKANILETIENYSLLDKGDSERDNNEIAGELLVRSGASFWRRIVDNPNLYWGKKLKFIDFAFSEWVPRVPGLGFTIQAERISRYLSHAKPISRDQHLFYAPFDKSGFVMSGAGSVKLPPDHLGYTICAITSSMKSCEGIPVLISPEVVEHHRLKNGVLLDEINATWQKMSVEWTKSFAATENLPRGYLRINNINQIKKSGFESDLYYDPYSIMEYMQDAIFKWDYVFCNVSNYEKNPKLAIKKFFDSYRKIDGINGKYLINPDIAEPLFETEYVTPSDLRSNYAKSQFALLKERLNKTSIEGMEIDKFTNFVSQRYQDAFSIKVLAAKSGLQSNLIEDDSPLKMCIQLVHLAIQDSKLIPLFERVCSENNSLYNGLE